LTDVFIDVGWLGTPLAAGHLCICSNLTYTFGGENPDGVYIQGMEW
jgi:hypothetical protein